MARADKIHLRPAIWQSDNQTKNTQDMDGGIRRRGVNGYNWNSFFPILHLPTRMDWGKEEQVKLEK